MIKIENVVLPSGEQYEAIIRGMRNPMNSWDNIDSYFICKTVKVGENIDVSNDFNLGYKDLNLMKRLAKAGTDHRKFMRMMTVYVDITAPLYWWKEFDTYKVGTVANSCSTMHKIQSKEFTSLDMSLEHLSCDKKYEKEIFDSHGNSIKITPQEVIGIVEIMLNNCRELYLDGKDKTSWWQMIQLLPSSYNQKRTVMLNYEVLANMYHSRKAHKLDEWRTFCTWIESLPNSKLITGGKDERIR